MLAHALGRMAEYRLECDAGERGDGHGKTEGDHDDQPHGTGGNTGDKSQELGDKHAKGREGGKTEQRQDGERGGSRVPTSTTP